MKRAASCFQLKTSDRGTTTSDGGGRRRFLGAARSSRRALQQGEYLDGLAQAHVVGQAAAETELPEEVEPARPSRRSSRGLTLEPGRRVRGRMPWNWRSRSRPLESLVESRSGCSASRTSSRPTCVRRNRR